MTDFFISYNRADKAWAEWIAWQLEAAGYSTVIQAWDFLPGSNFVDKMQHATAEAERTIAVLSPDYLSSEFAQAEWSAAFADDPLGHKGKILPVKVRKCNLDGLRAPIVYIDLIGLDEDAAIDALIKGAARNRARPPKKPAFPGQSKKVVIGKPKFPGALPKVWNLPRRNPNFTGRELILADLRAAFTSDIIESWKQAIWGMGGVGKSQIAIEYAYRQMPEYNVVWWIKSEDPISLASDYATLASELKLPEMNLQDQRAIVNAVKSWLERNSGWLLIFDNAVKPEDLEGYLPRAGDGHVIITSRNPNWGGIAGAIEIRVFSRDEAVRFILKRTKQNEGAEDLAKLLGDLPLALEQAGAYIGETAISIRNYIERFQKHQARILNLGKPSGYPVAVAAAWDISFQAVQEQSESAADLLRLCSFLAPDEIPRSLFINGTGFLPESLSTIVQDELEFDNVIAALRSFSLISADTNNFSIHRILQLVTRDHMEQGTKKRWARIAFRMLEKVFPEDANDVRTWSDCSVLLPHALASIDYSETLDVAITGHLSNKIGLYLQERAEFIEARSFFQSALRIDEKVFGPNHPNVARDINNIGIILKCLGDLEDARKYVERALKIDEKTLGPNHPHVARDLSNIGSILIDIGNLKDARMYLERALKINENILGPDHSDVATIINNIGMILKDIGDLKGAKEYLERALKIDEKIYGPDHPNVAAIINNIGLVLEDLGDLEGAKSHCEMALTIDKKAYGLNHPIVATMANNIGTILHKFGDLKGALEYLEMALTIDEKIYGSDHPEVARDINNIGTVLQELGKLEDARNCFKRAYTIDERILGYDHPATKGIRKNLESLK